MLLIRHPWPAKRVVPSLCMCQKRQVIFLDHTVLISIRNAPRGSRGELPGEMKPLHKDADQRVAGRPNLFAGRNSSQDSEETGHDDDGQLLHGVPVELAMAHEIRHPLTRVNEYMKHRQISRANPKPSIPPTVHTWTGSMASH